jgi:peptidoglycan/xylan/chitin deacetylase (PgdA/CDA1 family)
MARELQRGRCAILAYHGVLSGADDRYDFLNHNFVAAEAFERHLRYLTRYYRPISLSDLRNCYRRQVPPPPRSVALTFDDGFANNFTVAFPLLQRHSFPFTVFLTTAMLDQPGAQLWSERVKRAIFMCPGDSVRIQLAQGNILCPLDTVAAREDSARRVLQRLKRMPPDSRDAGLASIETSCGRPALQRHEMERYQFLSWSQVRRMASAGVEFGSHTVTHPILSTLDESAMCQEVVESKRRIEAELKQDCYALAYPNGSPADFGPREKSALRAVGYQCAFSLVGALNSAHTDPYELDRINVGREFDPATFQAAVTGILGSARRAREAVRHWTSRRASTPLTEARSC